MIRAPGNIRDVARMANVAPSTVSLVLNGTGRVSAETRTHVMAILRSTGYTPGRAGRKRVRQGNSRPLPRTRRIALLHAGLDNSAINSPIYMEVLRGVEEAVSDEGYAMMLRHVPRDRPQSGGLFPHRVDGVVLFGTATDEGLVAQLRNLPCVGTMGVASPSEPWDHVSYANEPIGRIAAEHLRALGHTRAAVLSASVDGSLFLERASVFAETWKHLGGESANIAMDASLLLADEQTQRIHPVRLRALMDDILGSPRPPTALFLLADMLASPVQSELLRRGLAPGRDLALIACNNERVLLDLLHPCPATIDLQARHVGRRAVQQLLWRLEHPDEPRQLIGLEPRLVRGDKGFRP